MIDRFVLHKGIWNGLPYLEVEIGGERYGRVRDHPLLPGDIADASRMLTGTTDECAEGVFTFDITEKASPRPCPVTLWYGEFQQTFPFAGFCLTDPLDLIRDRILERIALVRAWVETVRVPDTEESVEVDVPAGAA